MVDNHGDPKSPKDRVVGPLPNGLDRWLINGGCPGMIPAFCWVIGISPKFNSGPTVKPWMVFVCFCRLGNGDSMFSTSGV